MDAFSTTGAFDSDYRLETLSVSTKDGIVACIQTDLSNSYAKTLTFLLHGSTSFCEYTESLEF